MNSSLIPISLTQAKTEVSRHPLFSGIKDLKALQIFMQTHVYAVWDFMSLLKALQCQISCVEVPWRPSSYSKSSVRFINEIVLGEESDLDQNNEATDHFSMYLAAMDEVGASTAPIREFISTLDLSLLPHHVRPFVNYNIELATKAPIHQVAGAFFFGREDLIPSMFEGILSELEVKQIACPKLKHYLARHIELDGDEHGPLAQSLLLELVDGQEELLQETYKTGLESLKLRRQLWDSVLLQISHA